MPIHSLRILYIYKNVNIIFLTPMYSRGFVAKRFNDHFCRFSPELDSEV